MSQFLPMIAGLFLTAFLLPAAWWLLKNPSDTCQTDDDILLDFLEETGYSVQHLSTGEWAVTNAAHALVGTPAQTVREAVQSALFSMVGAN